MLTLEGLKAPDARSLHFSPWGLGPAIAPEAAADFCQRAISGADLAPAVPDDTRQSFERLRLVHAYGVLCYDLFTVADDLSLLVVEQALAERFIDLYEGSVPFVNPSGTQRLLQARTFSDVYEALRGRDGALRKGGWQLQVPGAGSIRFAAGLPDLMRWARRAGLLRGQRNRRLEGLLVHLRNAAAHPRSYHLGDPVESARSIRDAAEFINQLWGVPTPGGRLYPGPIQREVLAIGWKPPGTECVVLSEEQLRAGQLSHGWECVLVRAVRRDELLCWYRSRYETTTFPADFVWGPGSAREALAWMEAHNPQGDAVEYLDRWFVIRRNGEGIDIPQRPEVVAGLDESERGGEWFLVRADYRDAAGHARGVAAGDPACSEKGECRSCAADLVQGGTWTEIVDVLSGRRAVLSALAVPDVNVPVRWGR